MHRLPFGPPPGRARAFSAQLRRPAFFTLAAGTAALLLMSLPLQAGPRDSQWRAVEAAITQGRPRTAITNLEPIIAGALKDKAYAEAVKAIGQKIALEGNLQGNQPEEKITRLEAEIAQAPSEMVPLLETLLAEWYWHYFQQNRWRFMQRTTTGVPPGNDFTTWDLPRLFERIDQLFQKALRAGPLLKATPISAWDDLLPKGSMPDRYRPTLYDFIAHEALAFYASGEQAAARPEDAFEVSADSPIFDPAEKFLAWQAGAAEASQPELRAIQLYQALLDFHRGDASNPAFAHADLERLTWGWNVAFGENKDARYQAALERFIDTHADSDLSALALDCAARLLQQRDDFVAARELALRGARAFPQSPGGKRCRNRVAEIEAPSARITTERVWNAPWPEITVHYRNVETVCFRAIPYDWEALSAEPHYRLVGEKEHREILSRAPALEWSVKLPPTADYHEHTLAVPAPDRLKPGFYFIAASHRPDFGETNNVVSLAQVWVSRLALVTRVRAGRIEGFVLQADSGEPVAGAKVSVWHLDLQGNRITDPILTTDQNGCFSLEPVSEQFYWFRARHRGQEVATAENLWYYDDSEASPPSPYAKTVFFTDRTLYRPGQTVQYKGICLWVDRAEDNYKVLKDEPLTVIFEDANGKEVARRQHRANDYGSFAGSFTVPRDRLMGRMSLKASGRAPGQGRFHVEEYKRPRFEVVLDAPQSAVKLNETVVLVGHAMNYSGAAVDGAQVKYRVVREVRMPWWWGWGWGGLPSRPGQEIAHGITRTATDGSFKIEFDARPDPKVPKKDEPVFVFQVHADVTDGAGETRSAGRHLQVGYAALEARISADDWQTDAQPVELKLETRMLDGEPQAATGEVKVYALRAPAKVHRPPLRSPEPRGPFGAAEDADSPALDLSDPSHWPLGRMVASRSFATGTNGTARLAFQLAAGAYCAVIETQDQFGQPVTGRLPVRVLPAGGSRLNLKVPHLLAAPNWELQPGQEFMAVWGTGYKTGRAFIEIEHRQRMIQRYWTPSGVTRQQIRLALTEAMRGGCFVHVTFIHENRAYLESREIRVPWKNKDLDLKWERFVSKLQPGGKETWTLEVRGPTPQGQSGGAAAELVATLYDASLDAFAPLAWPKPFSGSFFRSEYTTLRSQFANAFMRFSPVLGRWNLPGEPVEISYRAFPPELSGNLRGYQYFARSKNSGRASRSGAAIEMKASVPAAMVAGMGSELAFSKSAAAVRNALDQVGEGARESDAPAPPLQLSQVTARKNLNETAFFFPQLTTDSNGVVRMTFTLPEALTKWRFLGFAHDRALRSGALEDHAVSAKDLMVQPNPPRFLREGDTVEFTVKVSNPTDQPQRGTVRLTFNHALNNDPADALLGNLKPERDFDLPARESRSYAWRIHVPDGCGFLTYRAVGAAARVSDGEEGYLPVLARRVLVTESLPLPIRGPATNSFTFTRLLESGAAPTRQNQSLVAQMVSQPAWYAVLALPYLMESPYECTEQTFNRLYANALARFIANSNPKIRRLFDLWKDTPALESPLQRNPDLQAVMLEETPWLRQANQESQARRNLGILFDDNRLAYEQEAALQKLAGQQLDDGAWPWFPGGRGNDYITLYITTGFGRLRHLGVSLDAPPILRALRRLDAGMAERYARIQKGPEPEKHVPSATDALYLYGRSFFRKDLPITPPHRPVIDFFLKQSRKFWLQTDCRQTQGHLALALHRFGDLDAANASTARDILQSLKERSVRDEELGRFWRDAERSWWWYRAPLETQALMIEAFDEILTDPPTVEECRVWLLKQKQTQDWKTTKATADAVYALLLRGPDLLSRDALVQMSLGGVDVTPVPGPAGGSTSPGSVAPGRGKDLPAPAVEPGTGFYEYRFAPDQIKPKLGEIIVRKTDAGVAWGSVHWQYLEELDQITASTNTPLKLNKALYTRVNTSRGPVLEPARGPVHVGDELVVRLELRVDRDMEYVHLKDLRGSGTEPVNVFSRYRFQDGLAYYESTRDTASHFFIDYLPKGTYVFEYSTRVQLRGQYQTGPAQIQCLYAPEFNSHSQSLPLTAD